MRRAFVLRVLAAAVLVSFPIRADDVGSVSEVAQPVGDPVSGAAKSAVCAGCHGPDGNSPVALFPKLAQQRPEYIAKQLRDFRGGGRPDPMMMGMALALSDQDIADLAQHFGSQRLAAGVENLALGRVGERLYMSGQPAKKLPACVGCHGLRGEGFFGAVDGGFPAIGGQHSAYLVKQLEGFRSGARANDFGGVMRFVTSRLSDEEIAAVAAYLSGLSRAAP